jgi:hypothetical protein
LLRTVAEEFDLRGQMLTRQTRQPLSHQKAISTIEALARKLDGAAQ